MVYGLLPNKQQQTYPAMFNFLFAFIEKCPKSVMIDFEIGIHNALLKAGQDKFNLLIIIQGCYFHLVSNLWKHKNINWSINTKKKNSEDCIN